MKYVVLFIIIGVVLWLMSGRKRPAGRPGAGPRSARPPELEGMVVCRHCGVHLPRSESLPGPGGDVYCSAAHRKAGPQGSQG